MSYEELTLNGFINEMKEVSTGPHPRKFCFVLGAGSSKTSGIKSGQELVNIWENELLERNRANHIDWKEKLGITEENKYEYYSQYYERRFRRQPIDGYNYLEKLMENAKPSVGYVMLAYLLVETQHNVVITTNFDHLTEDAINYYTQKIPLIIGHESLAHYVSPHTNRPTVVKIHRDLLFDPKNRTEELEVLHDNWKKALDIIFSEYHPVFIGYAGNDKSLMEFLIENSEKFLSDEWKFPYWMSYKNDRIEGKVLQLLEKSEGYCVKHNGFDEVLYQLGAAFNYRLSPKEEFLSDAEKRFQELSNAIDSFTEKYSENSLLSEGADDGTLGKAEISQAIQLVTNQAELQRLYREAVALHNTNKYEEALKIKERLVEMEPNNARYQNSLGVTLHEMGKYEEALNASRKALELEPGNAKYYDSISATLHEMGKYEEALSASQKAVELEPGNARYNYSLGATLYEMGKYEEALSASQKAVELEPGKARYNHCLGVILQEMEKYEEALSVKQKVLELEADNAEYYDSISTTLHEMGKYEEALDASRKAIELEPDNAQYHDSISATLHKMGKYEEALSASQKAIELEPDNGRYYDSISTTLYEMGKYEEALSASQKAIELEPDNAEYHDSISATLFKMGKYEEALSAGRKAVELEPDNIRYKKNLDVMLEQLKV